MRNNRMYIKRHNNVFLLPLFVLLIFFFKMNYKIKGNTSQIRTTYSILYTSSRHVLYLPHSQGHLIYATHYHINKHKSLYCTLFVLLSVFHVIMTCNTQISNLQQHNDDYGAVFNDVCVHLKFIKL